ncbi:MAG: ABC transporter permease subunit [Acidilobus sp.]
MRARYSLPYAAYILAFGVAPFTATFVYMGLGYRSALLLIKVVPLKLVLYNTFLLAAGIAVGATILGLLEAIIVDSLTYRYRTPVSLLFMIPYTVPFTSAALMWVISLYGEGYGWFTYFLNLKYDPLLEPSTAMLTITMVSIWASTPFSFLMIYSGLQSIPPEVRENAMMDGLGLARYYSEVAIPMASKAILVSLLLQLALGLGNFDMPYVMTMGGPGFLTTNLAVLVYKAIFEMGSFSAGALIAAMLSAFAIVPSFLLLFVMRAQKPLLPSVKVRVPDTAFKAIAVVLGVLLMLANLMPVYWMFLVAFRPDTLDFRRPPVLVPVAFTSKYFVQAISGSVPYMISSIVVSIGVGLITVFVSAPAAYEVARGRMGRWLLTLSIFLYTLPSMSYVVPLYLWFSRADILNTWWALMIASPIFTATFAVWAMHGFYLDLPRAYEEVADLFNIRGKMTRIILPLSRPVLMSVFLVSLIFAWHLLVYPLILSSTPYNLSFPPIGAQTVTIYALTAIEQSIIRWGLLAAMALVAALPVMIIALAFLYLVSKGGYSLGLKFL